jgi:hypothetical protein
MFGVKEGVKIEDMKELHINVLFMFSEICRYCESRNMPVTITSIFSDRKDVKRVSNTHETKRALDLRTRDWTEVQILDLETWCNIEFESIGAISRSGGSRAALYHNRHLHIQVRP